MKNLNAIFKKFKGVDGALITSEPGTFYLSGYINDAAFILLTKDSALYFTDSRYTEEATAACGDLAEVVTVKSSNVFSTIAEYVRKFNIKTLGFEGKYVSFNTYSAMANAFDGVKLVPVDNALDEARMVKTREELYDAGIETITFTRILLSFRVKAANDINGSTFMLIPSVVDSATENFEDIPHWYLPRVNNKMGLRAGFIGHYFELSYSQGFSEKSSPLAILFKINGDFFKTHFLYQYDKNNLSSHNYGYDNTRHIIQLSAMGKLPLLDKTILSYIVSI